jgi:anti-sigma factor RsiW
MKGHETYSLMIQLLIDGELEAQEIAETLAHCERCASCMHDLKELQELSRKLKRADIPNRAPASLQARIFSMTEKATAANSGNRKNGRLRRVDTFATAKPLWKPLAVASIVVAVSAIWLGAFRLTERKVEASSFAQAAADIYRDGVIDGPLDIRSNTPGEVNSWFAQHVSFPFRMPNRGIAADDKAVYKLVGGRLIFLGGERVALVKFQMPDSKIDLLIAPRRVANAQYSGGSVIDSEGLAFHSLELKGLHIVTWSDEGLTYALASDRAMHSKATCSHCHRGAAEASTKLQDDRMNRALVEQYLLRSSSF